MNNETNQAEKACIDLYLSMHVSQLNGCDKIVAECWYAGQRLYNDNKR